METAQVCFKAYLVHQDHDMSRDAIEFHAKQNNSRLEQIKRLDLQLADVVKKDPFSRSCCHCPQYDRYCGRGVPGPLGLWRDSKIAEYAKTSVHKMLTRQVTRRTTPSLELVHRSTGKVLRNIFCFTHQYESVQSSSTIISSHGKLTGNAVTAVTHCSLSHLLGAIRQLRHWNDNAVLSLLVPTGLVGGLLACCARLLVRLSLVGCCGQLRVVATSVQRQELSDETRTRYPSNFVRSVGLAAAQTRWSLLLDADLLPSPHLARRLNEFIASSQHSEDQVLVVPTFEISRTINVHRVLRAGRDEMKALTHNKQICGFHLKHYREGHGATDFEKWAQSFHPGRPSSYSIQYEDGFEPYVVVSTSFAQALKPPLYDTRFRHPYCDKVSAFK
eukprot:757018-Hanusia_phi.AAC.3